MLADKRRGLRVAVVGSGICGIAAAIRLDRAGHDVELIERDDVLGGRFGVATFGERPVMLGGKNVGHKYTAFRTLLSELGEFRWEPFGINASVVHDGGVLTLDSSRRRSSVRNVLRMGSAPDLARLAALAARIRLNDANSFLGSKYFTGLSRRHDHQPLSAHFGSTVVDTLLRPMTVRMNGAEPDEVYLGTFGTNLALLLDTYEQLTDGVQPALDAVSRRVAVRLGTAVRNLIVKDGRVVGLRLAEHGEPVADAFYDGVVVATPAYATAEIVRETCPELSDRLAGVRYNPTSVALVEYDRPVFTPQVRALAMHDGGPCSNAGAYGREDRHVVRYTFSGRGARDLGSTPPEEWIGEAEDRLVRYLGAGRAERVRTLGKSWAAGYCAYVPFHGDFLDDVRRRTVALPGLELAGDYLWGVSLEACCRSGNAAADRLAAFLDDRSAVPA